MTINMVSNDTASTSALDYNKFKASASSVSLTSGSTSELTDEEKDYDVDGDGTLSVTEKAAYLEAKSKEKALESSSKLSGSESGATVSISSEAKKLQKEGRPAGPPPDVNEMSDDELKSMLSAMKERTGQLPKELSGYNDADISNLSEDDLKSIRETKIHMQENMAARKNSPAENEQQRLAVQAIAEYNKFK